MAAEAETKIVSCWTLTTALLQMAHLFLFMEKANEVSIWAKPTLRSFLKIKVIPCFEYAKIQLGWAISVSAVSLLLFHKYN